MALRATIYKAGLSVADIDRGYYADHALTIARHPSETEERMMIRILAFALRADTALAFGPGLSTDDEPDLSARDPTGAIQTWIDVGWPDERRVRRACARAREVLVVTYGGAKAGAWWAQCAAALARCGNLDVIEVPAQASQALAALARRAMRVHCSIQDGHVMIGADDGQAAFDPVVLRTQG
ncbi:MAG: YaeQ family protein [Burkholderiaceae bacterium]|nr:YaeQ family protein [Burkholderiaceae bacterium]